MTLAETGGKKEEAPDQPAEKEKKKEKVGVCHFFI